MNAMLPLRYRRRESSVASPSSALTTKRRPTNGFGSKRSQVVVPSITFGMQQPARC